MPVFLMVPLKKYWTVVPLVTGSLGIVLSGLLENLAMSQLLFMITPHSGNEIGGVKSLRVAVGEFEDRVSAKNVLKQGIPLGKITFRSTPPSRSSP